MTEFEVLAGFDATQTLDSEHSLEAFTWKLEEDATQLGRFALTGGNHASSGRIDHSAGMRHDPCLGLAHLMHPAHPHFSYSLNSLRPSLTLLVGLEEFLPEMHQHAPSTNWMLAGSS